MHPLETPFPPVPLTLLTELEKRFPDRIPDSPDENLDYLRGQQSVIRFLRRKYEEENQSILRVNS